MCIDDQMLSAYLDNELAEPFRFQVEEHLGYCQACKERLEQLKTLSLRIKDAAFPAAQLVENKDKVFSLLEQKCFSKKHKNFFRRKIEMGLPSMITAAAAVIFIFVGSFVFFGSNQSQTEEILPSFAVRADAQNVQFVSQKKDSLDNYTLEEILQYLDQKGYKVDLSVKGITPFEEDQQ